MPRGARRREHSIGSYFRGGPARAAEAAAAAAGAAGAGAGEGGRGGGGGSDLGVGGGGGGAAAQAVAADVAPGVSPGAGGGARRRSRLSLSARRAENAAAAAAALLGSQTSSEPTNAPSAPQRQEPPRHRHGQQPQQAPQETHEQLQPQQPQPAHQLVGGHGPESAQQGVWGRVGVSKDFMDSGSQGDFDLLGEDDEQGDFDLLGCTPSPPHRTPRAETRLPAELVGAELAPAEEPPSPSEPSSPARRPPSHGASTARAPPQQGEGPAGDVDRVLDSEPSSEDEDFDGSARRRRRRRRNVPGGRSQTVSYPDSGMMAQGSGARAGADGAPAGHDQAPRAFGGGFSSAAEVLQQGANGNGGSAPGTSGRRRRSSVFCLDSDSEDDSGGHGRQQGDEGGGEDENHRGGSQFLAKNVMAQLRQEVRANIATKRRSGARKIERDNDERDKHVALDSDMDSDDAALLDPKLALRSHNSRAISGTAAQPLRRAEPAKPTPTQMQLAGPFAQAKDRTRAKAVSAERWGQWHDTVIISSDDNSGSEYASEEEDGRDYGGRDTGEGAAGVDDGLEHDEEDGFAWMDAPDAAAPHQRDDIEELSSGDDDDFRINNAAQRSHQAGRSLGLFASGGASFPTAPDEMSEQEKIWRARLTNFVPVEDLPKPRNQLEKRRVMDYFNQFANKVDRKGKQRSSEQEQLAGSGGWGSRGSEHVGWITTDGQRTWVENGQEYTGRDAYMRYKKHKK